MNFEFSDEQNMLREQAQGFLRDNCPFSVTRAIVDGHEPYDRSLWQKVAEMGWLAAAIPEEYEGLGLGYLELCVIAEELGRVVAPIPFSSSAYLAVEGLLAAGTEAQKNAWLPRLASGAVIGTLAVAEQAGQSSPEDLATAATGTRLTGTKVPVPDGDVADLAIVIARSGNGDGASAYLVDLTQDGVSRETVPTLDPSRSHGKITLNGAEGELLGKDGEGWALLQNLYNRAAILFAWEQVGGSETALNMAREYAMGRYAFGRPIAGYQAIKHKLANMYVNNTLARSNCYYGAWALSTNASELPLAAATARVSAIQAYYYASKENIQTHGGMGFTWEFDCQFLYRRAKLLSVNIGSEAVWQDKLITAIENSRAA
ncbi:MAG: acyl-CoA dehydrogenase family protein [Pseudomonadota bacterium]